jgi:endonuclease/exonuclease/phosphatase family metal-dependent hydrolase
MMRVVIFNAHFGNMDRLPYASRADQCVRMLQHMRRLAQTVVLIQEAGEFLVEMARRRLPSHEAHYTRPARGRPGLLTLVPKSLAELHGGARVRMYNFPEELSAQRRQFHALRIADLCVVNVHLESCASGRGARARQVRLVQETCRADWPDSRLVIFGDLNGYNNQWDSFLADGDVHVELTKRKLFAQISPHARRTFLVR